MKMPIHAWYALPEDRSKEHLGGKGAGLFDMIEAGVPVPEFMVIPTDLCVEYMAKPAETKMKVKTIAKAVVDLFVAQLGYLPLLSVRSGARVSMPGMMDTILNVGVGDPLTNGYTKKLSKRAFNDCQRRFLHMFGSTALGIPDSEFEHLMALARKTAGVETDAELSASDLQSVVAAYQDVYDEYKHKVPLTAQAQIERCILAVMDSWNSDRAVEYRRHHNIPDEWGTAVVIQRMVFGNMNDNSGSGVAFSRDPSDGYNELTGEYLANAQGEDVVAGIRTPVPISEMPEKQMHELCGIASKLELHYKDMLDMEFTVEDGKLYMLQVRTAKRSARAWVRSSLDMHDECLIERATVSERIKREHIRALSRPVIDPSFTTEPQMTGIPACEGVVTGDAVFTAKDAVAAKEQGKSVILVRHETSPDDIAGMFAAVGVLTATGGLTSHAAVVARGMDKVCVTGCSAMQVEPGGSATITGPSGHWAIHEGSKITLDGSTGRVWVHVDVPIIDPTGDGDLKRLAAFVDDGEVHCDMWLPSSPGQTYLATQFMGEVPAPDAKAVTVIDNVSYSVDADPLLTLTGDTESVGMTLTQRLKAWAQQHDVEVKIVKASADPTLDELLSRPVAEGEIAAFFGGKLDGVEKLIAPAKLSDKFRILGCQRHRLMSAFK